MRIALAANGRMGHGLLRSIQDSSHQVVALVRDGRRLSRPLRTLDHVGGLIGGPWTVEGRAWSAGIPMVWLSEQGTRDAEQLARVEPDVMLVGNFGMILKRPILGVPRLGVVNTHWSLLPRHRGPNPSTSVLLTGESETGVSFHVVDERIDAGALLDQVAFPISAEDTATSLYERACLEARLRVVDVLDRIERDGLVGEEMDLSEGSYFLRRTPAQAELDFSRSADFLDRKVRALTSPMPWFQLGARKVFVTAASPVLGVSGEPGEIVSVRPRPVIACGRGGLRIRGAWTRTPPLPWPLSGPFAGIRVGQRVGGATCPSPGPGAAT